MIYLKIIYAGCHGTFNFIFHVQIRIIFLNKNSLAADRLVSRSEVNCYPGGRGQLKSKFHYTPRDAISTNRLRSFKFVEYDNKRLPSADWLSTWYSQHPFVCLRPKMFMKKRLLDRVLEERRHRGLEAERYDNARW